MKKTEQSKNTIEEELSKQMDEIDRRFDRGGWFYMIIVIFLLFIGIYVFITFFQVPSDESEDNNEAHQSLIEKIDSLESQLDSIEIELELLRDEQ